VPFDRTGAGDPAHTLQLLWREFTPRQRRGPRRGLSIDAVVEAATSIADAEGLDAVTMAAVAQRLSFTTMSLYRYVESRQDLLVAMVDEALGEPPSRNRRWGWRRQTEAWAGAESR
jgi:AcrR family transcriptional regulator